MFYVLCFMKNDKTTKSAQISGYITFYDWFRISQMEKVWVKCFQGRMKDPSKPHWEYLQIWQASYEKTVNKCKLKQLLIETLHSFFVLILVWNRIKYLIFCAATLHLICTFFSWHSQEYGMLNYRYWHV